MPRGPRLDAPEALHHVIARGIARSAIFLDDSDCWDFLDRLGVLADAAALIVYAFALVGDHFHLLVRTGSQPLSLSMRSLLSGYAGRFNRRHGRVGHVFQNRFKSIVCEEETYFLELLRYIHLNPLRANLVGSVDELERYPFAGHATILGTRSCAWLDTDAILTRFGQSRRKARLQYRDFVAAGVALGRRPDLVGGGLVRSAGGWDAVRMLRRGREEYQADERILGSDEFVERMRRETTLVQSAPPASPARTLEAGELVARVCAALRIDPGALRSDRRSPRPTRAREAIAFLWLDALQRGSRELARYLGAHEKSVYRLARRGRRRSATWRRLLEGDPLCGSGRH